MAWDYQFPLITPYSYWFNHGDKEEYIDLTAKRLYRDNQHAVNFLQTQHTSGQSTIPKKAMEDFWKSFVNEGHLKTLNEKFSFLNAIAYNDAYEDFYYSINADDSQLSAEEGLFGQTSTLALEVALANYFVKTFNIKKNDIYVKSIRNINKYSGVMFALEGLCVICKKTDVA